MTKKWMTSNGIPVEWSACVELFWSVNKKHNLLPRSNNTEENKDNNGGGSANVVVPKRRVRRRPPHQQKQEGKDSETGTKSEVVMNGVSLAAPNAKKQPSKDNDVVKASIADCLACSGCVTTAETVLLEQEHSLQSLLDKCSNNENTSKSSCRVLTISPASWADMFRHYAITDKNLFLQYQQKFTTLLHRIINVSVVVDGNVPLQWSHQQAAKEFCAVYRHNQLQQQSNDGNTKMAPIPPPSTAIDSTRTLYHLPDGTTKLETIIPTVSDQPATPTPDTTLPLLSSSCPAVVCLIEKSQHALVPHLSTSKSPMSMMGGAWSALKQKNEQQYQHWAVMPCHDKKLEASRKDFLTDDMKDVDLVITTNECVQLIQDWVSQQYKEESNDEPEQEQEQQQQVPAAVDGTMSGNFSEVNRHESEEDMLKARVQEYIESLPLATATNKILQQSTYESTPTLVTALPIVVKGDGAGTDVIAIADASERSDAIDLFLQDSSNMINSSNGETSIFPHSSGGFADYLFRYAALELYQYKVVDKSPWQVVKNNQQRNGNTNNDNNNGQPRIRSARLAAAKQKDYYHACLYQYKNNDNGSDERIRYGTTYKKDAIPVLSFAIANGLQTLQRVMSAAVDKTSKWDYIEVMACPSGCVNGGGQVRLNERETPTETRARVSTTQAALSCPPKRVLSPIPDNTYTQTRYHVVPPMQHTMGAAAGVAVQDMQW